MADLDRFFRREDYRGFRFYSPDKQESDVEDWTDAENWYPSVTTVAGMIKDPGLINWMKTSSAQEVADKTDKGVDVGNHVHRLCEDLITEGSVDIQDSVPEEYERDVAKYLQGFVNFWNDFDIDARWLERSVLNTQYGVAGTFDLGGYYEGELSLFDWKTSNQKDDFKWSLQMTGYGRSDPFVKKGLRPNLYVVHLKKRTKKGYQLRPYDYKQKSFQQARALFEEKFGEPRFSDPVPTKFSIERSGDDESVDAEVLP